MPKGVPKNGTGGQFKRGEAKNDPRRNAQGQRKAAVVATAAQYRDYLVEMLHRPLDAPKPEGITYLALMAHNHVKAAAEGNADEREKLLDRIWGKTVQRQEVTGADGGPMQHEHSDITDEQRLERLVSLFERVRESRA